MEQEDMALDILVFPEHGEERSSTVQSNGEDADLNCPLCSTTVNESETDELLNHMKGDHDLVIADVHMICDLKQYLQYWKARFKEVVVKDVCHCMNVEDSSMKYVLWDKIPEDEKLRQRLQSERLDQVLRQQQRERNDNTFERDCLFCQEHFVGNRAELFDHMAKDHNFNVGLPDNLVFVEEFLNLIRQRMDSFHCLYCEKLFRDKVAIREHMRKKQHRKLNPKNTIYDKYYIINYLEMGKSWQVVQAEGDDTVTTDSDSWTDWSEPVGGTAVCLFCSFCANHMEDLTSHMKADHKFDLNSVKENLGLNFYLQVKLINFIRRKVYNKMCIKCRERFNDQKSLLDHMTSTNHIREVPPVDEWDQPQYYFPTYENDNLLCILDDVDEDVPYEYSSDSIPSGTVVYAEETVDIEQSILKDRSVLESLTSVR